jgi:predicted RNA-binding Zn-ribbon protein involved in translation (DUF1610 family)
MVCPKCGHVEVLTTLTVAMTQDLSAYAENFICPKCGEPQKP